MVGLSPKRCPWTLGGRAGGRPTEGPRYVRGPQSAPQPRGGFSLSALHFNAGRPWWIWRSADAPDPVDAVCGRTEESGATSNTPNGPMPFAGGGNGTPECRLMTRPGRFEKRRPRTGSRSLTPARARTLVVTLSRATICLGGPGGAACAAIRFRARSRRSQPRPRPSPGADEQGRVCSPAGGHRPVRCATGQDCPAGPKAA